MDRIHWDDLPHQSVVGYGKDGLVLRLNETECIKVYSPERTRIAAEEYKNFNLLLGAGLMVPAPKDIVEVYTCGKTVRLPTRCEFSGIQLTSWNDIVSVPGLIKEFIPGTTYGDKTPSFGEIRNLLAFLLRLRKAGYLLEDNTIGNFIASPKGTALIDCPALGYKTNWNDHWKSFEAVSQENEDRTLRYLALELQERKIDPGLLTFKILLAYSMQHLLG